MQGLFTYIYHIVLIITFVRTIEVCSFTYRSTGTAWAIQGKWLFVFLLLETVGSFALDIGYITDSPITPIGTGSVLILFKITIDFIVFSFLSHLISDYLRLPRDDVPYIILGFLYAMSAMLVLFSVYRPFLSLGQSLMCFGPIITSIREMKAIRKNDGQLDDRIKRMLLMIIICMIMISLQNLAVFYLNDKGWLGLRYLVSPVDDLFALCLAFTILRIDREAGIQNEKEEITANLEKETGVHVEAVNEHEKMKAFCSSYRMTGRESEITGLILKGKSNQEISDELFISIGTVKHHIYNIYTKLDVERRSQLMRTYLEFGKESIERYGEGV